MGQTAFMLMLVTILSKVFGFARESVMAYFYGTGDVVAIYAVANTLPVVIANFVASGIIYGFIPIYTKAKNEEGEAAAEEFTSNIFNILMIFGLVAVVFGFIFARIFCKIFSPDLEGDLLDMAVIFTRIIMFAIFAYLYSAVFRGYLNLKGNFFIPAITGIIMNVIIIAFTIVSGLSKNPYFLAVGCLLGNALQYILFPKTAREHGYRHINKIDIHNKYIKSLIMIAVPVIVSSAAGEISLTVDNSMASYFFGNASISFLRFSKTLLALITGVITVSVTTSIFPTISNLGQSGDIRNMKIHLNSAIVTTMLLVIPATLGMMSLSEPIIRLVFQRGAFDDDSVIKTASMLVMYAPFVIFQSLSDVIDKGFYAVGDSKTPVIIVVIQQIINVIFNYILLKVFGLEGLALATTFSAGLGALMIFYKFRDNFGSMNFKTSLRSLIKIAILSIMMGLIAHFLYKSLNPKLGYVISLFISIIIAGIFYLFTILLARIPEVMKLVNHIYHRFLKKK
ncbi:murein biosynthesis integral membrane protein MurJ [Anaerococcus porci]|uniref:murein biosynthesis integral membrane protein MurJ n=1 Tax=Anaerococcus porci TaxID=2652269 RepID=UPI002A74A9F1|nr:murein biosynthesis integral membrane protein MurJ [Anaerococcus porci]MDY3006063.1 murein biosynthesis integral membrane protein MurJ [Anaerococcus porci]